MPEKAETAAMPNPWNLIWIMPSKGDSEKKKPYGYIRAAFKINMKETSKNQIKILTECAVMIALAVVLSMVKIWQSPYGGSVTLLSMAPILLLSYRRGMLVGMCAAFLYSLTQLLLGLQNLSWIPTAGGIALCIFFDYIIAFSVLGMGGLFRKMRICKSDASNILVTALLGTALCVFLRFVCHTVAGALVWYTLDLEWYADDPTHIVNQHGMWIFSILYNGLYMLPEFVLTSIGVPLLARALNRRGI